MLNTHYLIALVAGVWAAATIYRLIPVPAGVDREALSQVMAQQPPETLPLWRVLLLPFNRLARRLPPSLIGDTRKQLYWAQFAGAWLGWRPTEVWGLRLAAGLTGLALGGALLGNALLGAALGALAYLYVGVNLTNAAKEVRRQLQHELPEAAQTLSLLIATGEAEIDALQQVAAGQGVIHRWLGRVLATRPPDHPLFSALDGSRMGHLRAEAQRSGEENLIDFATQLDFLKRSGIGSDLLLGTLADSVASAYQAEVDARAEALETQTLMPMMVCYFLPYMAGLLGPILFTSLGFLF